MCVCPSIRWRGSSTTSLSLLFWTSAPVLLVWTWRALYTGTAGRCVCVCLIAKFDECVLHAHTQRGITLFTVSHRKSLWEHHEVCVCVHFPVVQRATVFYVRLYVCKTLYLLHTCVRWCGACHFRVKFGTHTQFKHAHTTHTRARNSSPYLT